MIALQPIICRDSYSALVEGPILGYLLDVVYEPLRELWKTSRLDLTLRLNARFGPIETALNKGRLFYRNGVFAGQFTPEVARELRALGAHFNERTHEFTIDPSRLPADIRLACTLAETKADDLFKQTIGLLSQMEENIAKAPTGMSFDSQAGVIVEDLNQQFDQSMGPVESISIPADVTAVVRKQLDERLTKNLDLSVRNFTADEVLRLRRQAEELAFSGARADQLARLIEVSYSVSKRKAAFLAAQETSLAVSNYRQARYEALGSEEYRWSTSHDSAVRGDHKDLDGQVFRWDSPPIENKATGHRAHPGEGARCRCRAIPLIPDLIAKN